MKFTKGNIRNVLPLRMITFFCLSLAIVFLSGFLETGEYVEADEERLFFSRLAIPENPASKLNYEKQCGSPPVSVTSSQLYKLGQLKDVPALSLRAWEQTRKEIFGPKQQKLCFIDKGIAYLIEVGKSTQFSSTDEWVTLNLKKLGPASNTDQFPEISKSHLRQFPELEAVLTEIDQRVDYDTIRLSYEPIPISIQDWKIFAGNTLGLKYPETKFIFGDHLYHAYIKTDYQSIHEETPGKRRNHLIYGAVLLVVGLATMTRLYRSDTGIKIVPNGYLFLTDIIIILMASGLGYLVLEDIFDKTVDLYSASFMGLEQEGVLGAIGYFAMIVIAPVIMTWQAASSYLINQDGVLESGLIFNSFMSWDELDKMELLGDVEYSGRRRDYKRLFFHTKDDFTISIPGNMRKSAKEEVINLLKKHIPEDKKPELEKLLSQF